MQNCQGDSRQINIMLQNASDFMRHRSQTPRSNLVSKLRIPQDPPRSYARWGQGAPLEVCFVVKPPISNSLAVGEKTWKKAKSKTKRITSSTVKTMANRLKPRTKQQKQPEHKPANQTTAKPKLVSYWKKYLKRELPRERRQYALALVGTDRILSTHQTTAWAFLSALYHE